MTQERVHLKDNSARCKEMERWMDKNETGEGVVGNGSETRDASPAKVRGGAKTRPVQATSDIRQYKRCKTSTNRSAVS
jgi:hypothetical protein